MSGANASAIARSDKETTRRERSEREPDRAKQLINGASGEGRSYDSNSTLTQPSPRGRGTGDWPFYGDVRRWTDNRKRIMRLVGIANRGFSRCWRHGSA